MQAKINFLSHIKTDYTEYKSTKKKVTVVCHDMDNNYE